MASMSKHERVLRARLAEAVKVYKERLDERDRVESAVEQCAERVKYLEAILQEAEELRTKPDPEADTEGNPADTEAAE